MTDTVHYSLHRDYSATRRQPLRLRVANGVTASDSTHEGSRTLAFRIMHDLLERKRIQGTGRYFLSIVYPDRTVGLYAFDVVRPDPDPPPLEIRAA